MVAYLIIAKVSHGDFALESAGCLMLRGDGILPELTTARQMSRGVPSSSLR